MRAFIPALMAAAMVSALGPVPTPPAPAVTVNSLGMRMVLLPSGRFTMGSPPTAPMRQEEEFPHVVTLTKAFRISATEVTQAQWRAQMPAKAGALEGSELPVAPVTWAEARDFCLKLSGKEKASYRLPTEAEWEYACRAGEESSAILSLEAVAWYADDSEGAAHPVATRNPNAWGLFDMLGNVAEWTADVYAPYPRTPQTDPAGPASGTSRVARGGSFRSLPPALRCAARTSTPESYQLPHLGFRVVRDLE